MSKKHGWQEDEEAAGWTAEQDRLAAGPVQGWEVEQQRLRDEFDEEEVRRMRNRERAERIDANTVSLGTVLDGILATHDAEEEASDGED